jgi:putative ABC transport system permease protein
MILSYRFWENRMGRRGDILGHTVLIDKAPATVIGVMPEGFDFPEQRTLWLPLEHTDALQQRAPGGYMAFGRLKDGATHASARAELQTINRRLAEAYPATNRDVTPRVDTYSEFFIGPDAPVIYGSLWASAWFVLLIACANLANLTLARTIGRSREFSTRLALGAGRLRIARQILVESLLLTAAGGALAWWIAQWSVRTWAISTASIFQVFDYSRDSLAPAYLVATSIAAALLFCLPPISRVIQLDINGVFKGGSRGVTQGLRGKYVSAMLVAGQMALAVVLLAGAGVLARSLWNVVGAKTGVRDPENILIGHVQFPPYKYVSPDSRLEYFDRLEEQLKTIPGVEEESLSSMIPVGSGNLRELEIEGRTGAPDSAESAQFITAGTNYFRVLGASAILGRDFNSGDRRETLPVAIVNESFAAHFWPDELALGKHIRARDRNKTGEWRTVVGVVPNIMQGDATRQRFKPLAYIPFQQDPPPSAFFLLRMTAPPEQLAQAVRAGAQELDLEVTLENFSTLKASFAFNRDRMDIEHAEMGKHAAVAPVFAGIALLLAAIGLYAVIAHSMSQRTKEIGIRIAVGAAARDIWRLCFREGIPPVGIGLLLGLVVSLAVNRILQSQLVGVSPYDPFTMTVAPVVLLLVALLACQIPARRAMRVDPAVVLREE